MLCRAVLTAVAISCTFSREVIGQGSPRKVQIKDLICVLWLSGMQKEDLDVNMLRKLQRHNVNIDDMSNETLKQQCLNFKLGKDNTTKKVKETSDEDENTTTTEYVKQDNEKKVKKLFKNNLKMLLTDFMDTKTTKTVEDKTFSIKKEVTTMSMIPENYNNQNQNTDILVSYMGRDETDKFDLKYGNGQPVGNVINLWQMFTTTPLPKNYYLDAKIRKPKDKPNPDEEIQQQKYIKPDTKKSQQKETEYINKLLAAFMKTNIKPTSEKPTTASVDLKKLSDQIEKLLKLYPQSGTLGYSNSFPETEVEIVDNVQPDGYYFVKNGIPNAVAILDERIKQYDERIIKNKNIKVSRQIPIEFPKKKIATLPIRVPVQVLDDKQIAMVQGIQPLKEDEINFEPTNALITKITTNGNDVTKKDGVSIITKDRIKEIAENVKAIVLKDLRHEITSTPISTSVVTTTTTISTSTPTNRNKSNTSLPSTGVTKVNPLQTKTQEATRVIEKFMELFEQFKNIKEKTEITPEMKNLTNVTHQESENSFNVNYQEPMVAIDPNKVKKPPENTPVLYNSFSIQRPRMVQRFPTHGAKFVPIKPITAQSFPRTQVKPITIQTNSHEIRPLGIPISNPLKLIHQNIVVTTTHKYPRDKWVDQYQYEATTNHKERYKHYPIPPRHEEHNDAAKPLDPKPYKDVGFDDFELFNVKAKKPFGPNHYKDERFPEIKHEFKDDTKSFDRRPYMNARLRELKKSYKEDDTELYHKSYKYDRMPEYLGDKVLDKIPYKDERNREFDATLSYQKPYETSKYRGSDHDISNRGKSPYDDFRSFKLHEDRKEYIEKKNHDNISYGVLSHNQNSQRFHEKLERVDDWRDGLMGNTEDKIGKVEKVASRQQQSLNMKDSRFDDTHFKNFLKTQQKVNDMLEKILSSKSIQNGPLSVETT